MAPAPGSPTFPPETSPRRWTLALAALLLLTPACRGKSADTEGGASAAGPRVFGKTLEDKYLALDDFHGRVVLVNVWATWCGPCRQELPELQRLYDRHRDAGLTVLGVSIDSGRDRGKVEAMVNQLALTYPMLLDPASRTVSELKVVGYPTTVLVSRRGQIRWRRDGIIQDDDAELAHQIRAALADPG